MLSADGVVWGPALRSGAGGSVASLRRVRPGKVMLCLCGLTPL
jgi:hypothetical protein